MKGTITDLNARFERSDDTSENEDAIASSLVIPVGMKRDARDDALDDVPLFRK